MDDGTPFKGIFTTVCEYLHLNCECVSKLDHKSVLVKKFHRFLNKVVTITIGDRETLGYFIEAVSFAGYAWNIASIDNTHIIRNIPAIE